jgi:hypothetical protein
LLNEPRAADFARCGTAGAVIGGRLQGCGSIGVAGIVTSVILLTTGFTPRAINLVFRSVALLATLYFLALGIVLVRPVWPAIYRVWPAPSAARATGAGHECNQPRQGEKIVRYA